jgi:hypothetical protein
MNKQLGITPGPWTWDGPADNIHVRQVNTDNRVCFLTSNGPTEANANLIAAAPDLHEAAGLALDLLERVGDSRKDAPVIDALRAALAKAEGCS